MVRARYDYCKEIGFDISWVGENVLLELSWFLKYM